MNFLLRLLLGSTMGTGFGDRFSKDQTGDLSALTGALKQEKAHPASMERLADAFTQLKDMHQPQQAMTPPPMSPFDVPLPQDRPQPQPQMAQHPFQGMF